MLCRYTKLTHNKSYIRFSKIKKANKLSRISAFKRANIIQNARLVTYLQPNIRKLLSPFPFILSGHHFPLFIFNISTSEPVLSHSGSAHGSALFYTLVPHAHREAMTVGRGVQKPPPPNAQDSHWRREPTNALALWGRSGVWLDDYMRRGEQRRWGPF
jgi:hypothetical protein